MTRARAIETRCCIPPLSSYEYFFDSSPRPTISSSSCAYFLVSLVTFLRNSIGSSTLSRLFRHGSSTGFWNTIDRSRNASETSRPLTRTSPAVLSMSPAMIRNNVVLPQPDLPTTETNSPGATVKLQPARARLDVPSRVVYVIPTSFTSMTGVMLFMVCSFVPARAVERSSAVVVTSSPTR